MKNHIPFRDFVPEQLPLLAPNLRAWLPKGPLAYSVLDLVRELNLSANEQKLDGYAEDQPSYHPRLVAEMLL